MATQKLTKSERASLSSALWAANTRGDLLPLRQWQQGFTGVLPDYAARQIAEAGADVEAEFSAATQGIVSLQALEYQLPGEDPVVVGYRSIRTDVEPGSDYTDFRESVQEAVDIWNRDQHTTFAGAPAPVFARTVNVIWRTV